MIERRSWVALFAIASSWLACGDDDNVAPSLDASVAAEVAFSGTPTWYEHVQPFLHEKCSACHRPGKIAPFSMLDYAQAKPFAGLMVKAIEEGRMPPFSARETPECTPKHPYKDDPRLSPAQLDLLRRWASGGAPEGDKSKAAPLKEPPPVDIERADVVMGLPEPIQVVDDGKGDLHTCLIVDPKIQKDGYVVSRQLNSGNERVLHHVTTYIVAPALTDGTVITREQLNDAFV
ncbi:MAG TPA: hypothetical protein VFX59_14735, partial [Polyangiales bacterium]|nr:hypothetical protein [Polyangiales bacterium]